jgi:non-ribosomal peptide synthetase component F
MSGARPAASDARPDCRRGRPAGAPPAPEVPTHRTRSPAQTYHRAARSFTLSPALRARLGTLGAREGSTLCTILLAAFQVLLARYGGEAEIVGGPTPADRPRPGRKGPAGFGADVPVPRTDLEGNPTFRELLGRVREAAPAALAHPEAPRLRPAGAVRPEREPGRQPLCRFTFGPRHAPPA